MALIDLVFPKICLGCKQKGNYLCQKCMAKMEYAKQICPMCAKPAVDGMTHHACLRPHSLNGLHTVWANEGVIKKTIKIIKYKFADDIAKSLSKQIIIAIRKKNPYLPDNAVLVPIPIHKDKLKWRGFNLTEDVGRNLSKYLGFQFRPQLIIKVKKNPPQADLDKKDRAKNVKGVFVLNSKIMPKIDKRKEIIIFDDVWTTGATMREAAKVLKRNGFEKVWGLTIVH